MHYIFIAHAGSTEYQELVDHVRSQALNLRVHLLLEESTCAWCSFLILFLSFYARYIDLGGRIRGVKGYGICIETLPWLRV